MTSKRYNLPEYAMKLADERTERLKSNYDEKDVLWLAEFVDHWAVKGYEVRKYADFVDKFLRDDEDGMLGRV